jgi:hypothetical protein
MEIGRPSPSLIPFSPLQSPKNPPNIHRIKGKKNRKMTQKCNRSKEKDQMNRINFSREKEKEKKKKEKSDLIFWTQYRPGEKRMRKKKRRQGRKEEKEEGRRIRGGPGGRMPHA